MQNADGTVTYSVSTTLTNTFTLDEAAVAPAYIIGYSPAKRSDDNLFVTAFLVAPAGGSISGVTASSGAGAGEATLYGHDVWRVDVSLYAQESVTITYQVTVSAEAIQELEVAPDPARATVVGSRRRGGGRAPDQRKAVGRRGRIGWRAVRPRRLCDALAATCPVS